MKILNQNAYLVDDEHDLLEQTEIVLNGLGIRCVGKATRADRALQEIPSLNPHFLFLDMIMPGMTGIECARRIKPRMPQMTIFILTNIPIEHAASACVAAGAKGCLHKPPPLQELKTLFMDTQVTGYENGILVQDTTTPFYHPQQNPSRVWSENSYNLSEFPSFLTPRLFLQWSQNEHIPNYWRTLAQAVKFRVTDLARTLKTTPRTLEREWKICFHAAPKPWLNSMQKSFVTGALADGRSLKEMSSMCGYSDASHFHQNQGLQRILRVNKHTPGRSES